MKDHLREFEEAGRGASRPAANVPPQKSEKRGRWRTTAICRAWKSFFTHWTAKGRASRADFWWVVLFKDSLLIVLFLCSGYFSSLGDNLDGIFITVFCVALSLAFCVVSWLTFCLTIRRLHDTGHSGWLLFWLGLGSIIYSQWQKASILSNEPILWETPHFWTKPMFFVWAFTILCYLFFLYLLFKRGNPRPNRYGPAPCAGCDAEVSPSPGGCPPAISENKLRENAQRG